MNVVYHSSDSFAPVLGISIASLFENNKDFDEISVYIIENKISEENKKKLLELASNYNRSIIFITMPDINEKERLHLKKVKEKWIFDSYCRLFLDHLLPNYIDRVLYLDGDVLISDSLLDLWNLDFKGKSVAAVADCVSEAYYKLFNLSENAHYCNSGVLLFDLQSWRKLNMPDKIRKYIASNNGYVFFMEQTVFSYLIKDDLLLLHPKFNTNSMMQVLGYENMYKLRCFSRFYTKSEIEEAVKHPVLIHMTSSFLIVNRAWNEITNHPMKNECKKYSLLTPWGSAAIAKDNRSLKKKIIDLIISAIPNVILLPFISLIYNKLRVLKIYNSMNVK